MILDPTEVLEIQTQRLVLKVLDPSFADKIIDYYKGNQQHFEGSIPTLHKNFNTVKFQVERLWQEYDLMAAQKHVRFFLFKKDDNAFKNIIGDITISNIMHGSFLSCILGYKIDKDHQNKGYTKEALIRIIDFIFNNLNLERIQCDIGMYNKRSVYLIEKLGFKKEGISRSYIRIGKERKDHLRYSLTIDDINNETD